MLDAPPASGRPRCCSPTPTSTTPAAAGAFAGRRCPSTSTRTTSPAFSDYLAWGGHRARSSSIPCRTCARSRTATCLRLAGCSIEVLHTPGHTPGHCCFRVDGDAWCCSGDLVFAGTIGRSDFPNSDPGRDAGVAAAVPDAARRPACAAGARARDRRRPRARHEPVPAGAGLMELAPPRGTQDLLPPTGGRDASRCTTGRPHLARRLSGSATSRRRCSRPPSCSRARRARRSDVVTKEMYTFEDRGGRSLTLRPEGTAPVMRAYLHDATAARARRSRRTT